VNKEVNKEGIGKRKEKCRRNESRQDYTKHAKTRIKL
jgi:hypothetical protein